MTTATKQDRRLLKGRTLPAKIEPDRSTYSGKFAARLCELRAGRDVERIVKAIERAGFDRCGRATYYNWEAGKTDPPIDALPALAKALGVKQVADLFPS